MSELQLALNKSVIVSTMIVAMACGFSSSAIAGERSPVPADKFDLSHWKITIPTDANRDGKPDDISVEKLNKFSHPDFFYLDDQNRIVFASPNKAPTTKNSTNTRSELRQMLRGKNTRVKTHDGGNNFAVRARKDSDKFGSVGGRLDATLHVDHVARNAVFWTYERNLAKDDPNRTDIAYPVWGNTWENTQDPGTKGIALGEAFSYTVNVHENTMHLTFSHPQKGLKKYSLNLANNIDAYGNVDTLEARVIGRWTKPMAIMHRPHSQN